MKICPVCSARCFDDMEVCYGCLHTFADGQSRECGGEDDGAFGEFEPEPASDRVIQQVAEKSHEREPSDSDAAASYDRKHCFTAQIDIDRTVEGIIDVSIRVPSEALRLLAESNAVD